MGKGILYYTGNFSLIYLCPIVVSVILNVAHQVVLCTNTASYFKNK